MEPNGTDTIERWRKQEHLTVAGCNLGLNPDGRETPNLSTFCPLDGLEMA